MAREHRTSRGKAPLMTTTLWDYHSQNYPGGAGRGRQGDSTFAGATPSYVIWNLLQRYTREKWLVVDPMCGSGTTLDVARDLDRRGLGYDLAPTREDIFRADARKLPLESGKADFVFIDPPYSTNIKYSGQKECIGELDARQNRGYYAAMEKVFAEINRVLKPDRCMALYVTDAAKKGQELEPIGFELFSLLRRFFVPVEIVAVTRHNRTLKRADYHDAAADGNFFIRGFNYLFIMQKLKSDQPGRRKPGPARGKKDPVARRKATDSRGTSRKSSSGSSGTDKRGSSNASGRKTSSAKRKTGSTGRKTTARKTTTRKTTTRETTTRQTTARKTTARKTTARKTTTRKTAPKRRK